MLKKITKILLLILAIPILYIGLALLLTAITVNNKNQITDKNKTIYLSSNGVHLDIIIPKSEMHTELLSGLDTSYRYTFYTFGWGDENFYINTPTWGDLTFKNAFRAMFLKSKTLMHVTGKKNAGNHWIPIVVNDSQFQAINLYILNSFKINNEGNKQILKDKGYTPNDKFYKANGSYSCFNTCNSWANSAFKESGLKASYWTPFDFGLMGKYE